MKNAHIKPGQLVPAELRLEIYKEAKRSIEAGDTEDKYDVGFQLHVLITCILYGKIRYGLGKKRYKMFPEITSYLGFVSHKQQALDELTKAIEKLEAELAPKRNGVEVIKTNIATRVNDNLNELSFDAALDVYNQIRENMRERREAEIAALEQQKNERLIYLKNIEL